MHPRLLPPSLDYEEARLRLLEAIQALPTEFVPLEQALGRIAATDVRSGVDIPPVRIAAMDGYALPDDGGAAAGYQANGSGPEQTVPVLTGRPVPPWCVAVAPEEECLIENGRIRPLHRYPAATHIRPAGEDTISGSIVHFTWKPVDAIALARIASTGASTVEVVRRPRTLILTSGDELVKPGIFPSAAELRYECDSFLLSGLLTEAGAVPITLPHQPDDPARIRDALASAGPFDLLVTCGGAASSEADHVRPVLKELGAEFRFERVRIKPARPTGFAFWRGKPVICLPGNPVAVFVGFHAFIRPLLASLSGLPTGASRPMPAIRLGQACAADEKRHLFVRCRLTREAGNFVAVPHPETGSGLLRTLSESDALISIPPGRPLPAGEPVDPVWLRPEFFAHV